MIPGSWLKSVTPFLVLVAAIGCSRAVESSAELEVDKLSPTAPPAGRHRERHPLATSAAESVAASDAALAPATDSLDNWPEPAAVLFITGRQYGYIEPCGCTGLDNQKGGLARRHTLLEQLVDKGWPVAAVDVGNQVKRFGRQAEIKFQFTAGALNKMDYQAVAFGPDDLQLSFDELAGLAIGEEAPFVAANVNLLDLTPTHRVIEAGAKKIGVAAVLGDNQRKQVRVGEIELVSAEQGLRRVMPELLAAQCDFHVLLANATIAESRELGKKFPQFDLVVTSGGSGEPFATLQPIEGSSGKLVQVGEKSMHVSVVGLFDDAKKPLRYQRVSLDSSLPDSRPMLDMLASYQEMLKELGLEGLGIRPVAHPSGRTFVGSAVCGDCHLTAFEKWEQTPHFHATDSIVHPGERSEIPRHHDPECLSCHVTGWSPQGYFPYESGYLALEASQHLLGNGCENCHGPGSAHVAAEMGEIDADDRLLRSLRKEMRLPLEQAEKKCLECHDLDNDPHFHEPGAFERYWKEVEHYGKY